MSDTELDAIQARADGATAGPWVPLQPADDDGWWWVWQEAKLPHYGGVAECHISDGDDLAREKADAVFIAHARADVPALVAEVRRLRTEVALLADVARYL